MPPAKSAAFRVTLIVLIKALHCAAMPSALETVQAQVQGQIAGAAHAGVAQHAVTPTRKKVALAIAGLADLIQLGFFPAFAEGVLSIPDDVLDVIVAIALFVALGFKWRILIALLVELVPGVALFPSWTAVVLTVPTFDVKNVPKEKALPPSTESGDEPDR
jgi:hypothetical protein